MAPAKVNLVLDVGPPEPDGYHPVRTILQAVCLHDRLALAPCRDLLLECDLDAAGSGPANLAWRAAEALRRAAGLRVGVRIRLTKRIPLQAGLGGGSSDAAAVLRGCNALWNLDWPAARLAEVGRELGSDVPFFLWGGTAMGEGRGDRVRPLPPLPPLPILVCHPGAGIATSGAYRALDGVRGGAPPAPLDVGAVREACALAAAGAPGAAARLGRVLANAFEAAVLPARPDVAALRLRLLSRGALGALLCGSGAAVFALAPSGAWARAEAAGLRASGLWAQATRMLGGRRPPAAAGGR